MLHDVLSRGIALPLLDLQQRISPSRRSTAINYARGIQFRSEAWRWQEDKKREWVLKRLRSVVRYAAANTTYYSEVLGRLGFDAFAEFGFADFAKLPVLERHDIFSAGEQLISRTIPRNFLQRDASGGSTGEPVRIWVGPEEEGWQSSAREFFMRQIGIPRGSRLAYLWGHHLDTVQKMTARQRFFSYVNNERWFDCFRMSPAVLESFHHEMESYQPDCIIAYASALAAFAQLLSERNLKPRYPRKCIITGAEKLFDSQRDVAEKVFRKPIYERYGSRDAGLMGFQLDIPRSKDFAVDWSNLLVEPETNESESAILVTKLHADGMPMLRYRIGDVGTFPTASKTGHPTFRLQSILGRMAERIWLPDGRFIHGNQFPHLMKDFSVREFMVVQSEDFSVEVKILPGTMFSQASKDSILNAISKNLPGIPITIVLVDSIGKTKANKWQPVVSRVTPRTHGEGIS